MFDGPLSHLGILARLARAQSRRTIEFDSINSTIIKHAFHGRGCNMAHPAMKFFKGDNLLWLNVTSHCCNIVIHTIQAIPHSQLTNNVIVSIIDSTPWSLEENSISSGSNLSDGDECQAHIWAVKDILQEDRSGVAVNVGDLNS